MKFLVLIAAFGALALGACSVGSDAPLFQPADLKRHALAEGHWAMYGAGCEVRAGQPLPECAVPVEVEGGVLTLGIGDLMGALSLPTSAMPNQSGQPQNGSKSSHARIELVAGDPEILQMTAIRQGEAANAALQTPPVTYAGFRTRGRNAAGEVTDGVVWMLVCAGKPLPEGLHMSGIRCTADTPLVVRALAPHMKPFLSYYLTWIGS